MCRSLARKIFLYGCGFLIANSCLVRFSCGQNLTPSVKQEYSIAKTNIEEFSSPLAGKWSYRSFISDPNLEMPVEDLLFGAGTLELSQASIEKISGSLGGDGWNLELVGSASFGIPTTIRFQGKGMIGEEEWVYDYTGYLIPDWPNGENQRPAIVGTIVRTKAHSNGQAVAGYVAQWIAVRQDVEENKSVNLVTRLVPETESTEPAARWSVKSFNGEPFDSSSLRGKPIVIVFSQGFDCIHCAEQVNVFSHSAHAFAKRNTQVVFMVADTQESLRKTLGTESTSFAFLADPEQDIFKLYGIGAEESSHGIVILDRDGSVCWKATDLRPITKIQLVLNALDELRKQPQQEPEPLSNSSKEK